MVSIPRSIFLSVEVLTSRHRSLVQLNIPKYTSEYAAMSRHDFILAYQDEVAAFQRLLWDAVIKKLLIIFAIMLELPETHFVDCHRYDRPSEDLLRFVRQIVSNCGAGLTFESRLLSSYIMQDPPKMTGKLAINGFQDIQVSQIISRLRHVHIFH